MHLNRPPRTIYDNRQMLKVKTSRELAKLPAELFDISRHMCADVIDDRSQPLGVIVQTNTSLELLNLTAEATVLRLVMTASVVRNQVLEKQADAPDDLRRSVVSIAYGRYLSIGIVTGPHIGSQKGPLPLVA